MLRAIVARDRQLEAKREVSARTIRAGTVLNVLQPVKPHTVRFTVEGEGAEIWSCDQSTFEGHT